MIWLWWWWWWLCESDNCPKDNGDDMKVIMLIIVIMTMMMICRCGWWLLSKMAVMAFYDDARWWWIYNNFEKGHLQYIGTWLRNWYLVIPEINFAKVTSNAKRYIVQYVTKCKLTTASIHILDQFHADSVDVLAATLWVKSEGWTNMEFGWIGYTYVLWMCVQRRKIRLIEGNPKCRHLKNWPVKGLAAGVYLSEAQNPIPPPPY
jgi:hypothetical protein